MCIIHNKTQIRFLLQPTTSCVTISAGSVRTNASLRIVDVKVTPQIWKELFRIDAASEHGRSGRTFDFNIVPAAGCLLDWVVGDARGAGCDAGGSEEVVAVAGRSVCKSRWIVESPEWGFCQILLRWILGVERRSREIFYFVFYWILWTLHPSPFCASIISYTNC